MLYIFKIQIVDSKFLYANFWNISIIKKKYSSLSLDNEHRPLSRMYSDDSAFWEHHLKMYVWEQIVWLDSLASSMIDCSLMNFLKVSIEGRSVELPRVLYQGSKFFSSKRLVVT